ncbi:MAG: radical SAM protein [Anaerolineales bacterium]|nr:radical SAM protein [Anaerolineales bacterium]
MSLAPPSRKNGKRTAFQPGMYSYKRSGEGFEAQIHLRVDGNGPALLLVNANRVLHLNPSAAYMAWLALEEFPRTEALQQLRRRYRTDRDVLAADFDHTAATIAEFIRPDGACPVHELELDILPPFSASPSAPYRMDLALTYRCNLQCAHCYNARARNYPELDTDDWMRVIDRCWEAGIPHICFTGGESTLRDDLPALIRHAQSTGQITGLLTNGVRLSDPDYLHSLAEAGLDHVQITFESLDASVHDQIVGVPGAWEKTAQGIRNVLAENLYLMTNTTLLLSNAGQAVDTVDFLAEMGVPTVGFNALIYAGKGASVGSGILAENLEPILEGVRARTTAHGQRLIWYTPTQYCHFDPMQLELGVKGCSAARYNMCVEPNGDVIPCQSFYSSVGNILADPWDSIWNHKLCTWIRNHEYVRDECQACPMLSQCGGGCPLTLMNDEDAVPHSAAFFEDALANR